MGSPSSATPGKQNGPQIASLDPANQVPDPAHATGSGYAQVVALARNGNTDPARFSEAGQEIPERLER